MGTIYYIGCRDCRKVRDLGKLYVSLAPCGTRDEAIAMAERIKVHAFQAALVVGFLNEHAGHNCCFFDDNNEDAIIQCGAEIDDDGKMVGDEGRDYWGVGGA